MTPDDDNDDPWRETSVTFEAEGVQGNVVFRLTVDDVSMPVRLSPAKADQILNVLYHATRAARAQLPPEPM